MRLHHKDKQLTYWGTTLNTSIVMDIYPLRRDGSIKVGGHFQWAIFGEFRWLRQPLGGRTFPKRGFIKLWKAFSSGLFKSILMSMRNNDLQMLRFFPFIGKPVPDFPEFPCSCYSGGGRIVLNGFNEASSRIFFLLANP